MPESLTTLQLARRIAIAVLAAAYETGQPFAWERITGRDPATQAVLQTLDTHSSWFCRVSEDAQGATVLTPYEQGELPL